ncbi:DUF5130 family protein, partial [Mycobacterium tuberculosis]
MAHWLGETASSTALSGVGTLPYSSRACQVRFAIYLGDLGRDTAARA